MSQNVNIEHEMRKSYLEYSLSVIIGRAIPDVRDGLKPVHRRILFAQQELANSYNRPPKKCARIVGDVSRAVPQAAGILTSGEMGETARPEELAAFLSEELAIGDAEEAIAGMRARLADPRGLSQDEYDFIFQSVVGLQKDLMRRKLAHKPLPGALG